MVIIQGKSNVYGVNHYVSDTLKEISTINVATCSMGCTVYVIENGDSYILNGKKEWVKKSSSGEGEVKPPVPPSESEIFYDGGEVIK